MSTAEIPTTSSNTDSKRSQNRPYRGRGRPRPSGTNTPDGGGGGPSSGRDTTAQTPHRRPPHARRAEQQGDRPPRDGVAAAPASRPHAASMRTSTSDQDRRPQKPRSSRPRNSRNAGGDLPSDAATGSSNPDGEGSRSASRASRPARHRRAGKFNASLTEAAPGASAQESKPADKYRSAAPKRDDLTSILIHALRTPPYPDCPICFAAVHPAQPSWSCSPTSTLLAADQEDGAPRTDANPNMQCCWTTFHLKCIRSWAAKSVKDLEAAWRARGEERKGEWRCPGCQSKRDTVPRSYWCFCGSTQDPMPPRLATPHSCGNPCSRPRACGHACALACHPGPCPPCQITTHLPCHCNKQTISFRCSHAVPGRNAATPLVDLSCGKTCGKKLGCGQHTCEKVCHDGDCERCAVREAARCWCGKVEKELACGLGEEKWCVVIEDGKELSWTGKFSCENTCDRLFDCGTHRCSKPCHPPSTKPPPCPRSPNLVTHCPCGKHSLEPSSSAYFPANATLVRTSCSDPIPTCTSLCTKPLDSCSHVCSVPCHTGPCPPCTIQLVRPCRCGAITREVSCSAVTAGNNDEVLCDRPCGALRACGRHQCTRICCPLAALATTGKGKGKKRREADVVDAAGWHECDLVCGKLLGCGNHRCEARDHRGLCAPCLRSSWDEMVCACGRTIIEPPIACGTRISCPFPCARPGPPCGHPKSAHACHEDPAPCPPCPFLTSKPCACGRKNVDNVQCSQEKVSCGTACGKLLGCGFHHCKKPCHGGPCGPCAAVCGKPRKLCMPGNHPCEEPCHAPAACPESEPCRAVITITCPCGRIRQAVSCGRSTGNPVGLQATQTLKCSNECLVAKRNARLAEALGIDPGAKDRHAVVYNDELVAFARANARFVPLVEKAFAEFVSSDKKVQVLPHMPEARRQFVRSLAAVYRMDTEMVDQEPHRSVQLIRRLDTRIPSPLISSTLAPTPSAPGLGKLADLRAPANAWPRAQPAAPRAPAVGTARGWTSVVARPPSASPTPAPGASAHAPRPQPAAQKSKPASSAPSPAPTPVLAPPQSAGQEHVPDNWEDDV